MSRASKIVNRVLMPTMPRSSAAAAPDPLSYEQALAELDALVQAIPSCVPAGEAPRYAAVTAAEYLQQRFAATYG